MKLKTSNILLLSAIGVILLALATGLILTRVYLMKPVEKGSGIVVNETREVVSFSRINVTGPFEVSFIQGTASGNIQLEADDNLIGKVITVVEDQELKVYSSERVFSKKLKIAVQMPNVEEVSLRSGAKFLSSGNLQLERLKLVAEAGCLAKLDGFFEFLDIHASAGSEIIISGSAKELIAKAMAGAEVNALSLQSHIANVLASAGSSIKVMVEKELSVEVSSGSEVHYKGSPVIKSQHISSGGELRSLGE